MRIAVVGATGMVGQIILKVLTERSFPVTELIPVASSRSVGKSVAFGGRDWTIKSLEDAVATAPDLALFSAGGTASLEWAPKFAAAGTRVVDNSSAWRMDPTKKLVVPEINAELIEMPAEPTLGVGECSVGPTAAAIANGITHALGTRVHDMPFTRDRIMEALL